MPLFIGLFTLGRGVPRILPGGMHIFGWPTPPPPPPPPDLDLDPDPHQDFELDPDPDQNNADAQGGEGGCTCILCIPPGYALDFGYFITHFFKVKQMLELSAWWTMPTEKKTREWWGYETNRQEKIKQYTYKRSSRERIHENTQQCFCTVRQWTYMSL
jgi:hypothetical protein